MTCKQDVGFVILHTVCELVCTKYCLVVVAPGVGFGICVAATFVGAYYNTIIAWSVYYLIISLRSSLLFASCDNDWNTPACIAPSDISNHSNTSASSATEFFK